MSVESVLLRGRQGDRPAIHGIPHSSASISEAQESAANSGVFVAPMPLMLERFPHDGWYATNSDDTLALNPNNKFYHGPLVVTIHGGLTPEGRSTFPLLGPQEILKAVGDCSGDRRRERRYLNKSGAVILDEVFNGKWSVFEHRLLQDGVLPSGEPVQLFPFEDYSRGAAEDLVMGNIIHGLVRPLSLAQETDSGYEGIGRLCDGKGRVTDSQVIAYSGSQERAQRLVQRCIDMRMGDKLGVWHPFNQLHFDRGQAQNCILRYCKTLGLDGNYALDNSNGAFLGIAPSENNY